MAVTIASRFTGRSRAPNETEGRVEKPGFAAAEIERGHGVARVQFVSAIQLVVVVRRCCSGRDRGELQHLSMVSDGVGAVYAGGSDWHRWFEAFNSRTGQWTAKDAIRLYGDDTNLYSYVLDDPVSLVDLTGTAGGYSPNVARGTSEVVGYGRELIDFWTNIYNPWKQLGPGQSYDDCRSDLAANAQGRQNLLERDQASCQERCKTLMPKRFVPK